MLWGQGFTALPFFYSIQPGSAGESIAQLFDVAALVVGQGAYKLY